MCGVHQTKQSLQKDSYPLPQIDLLIDSMAGHQQLSFMDAFSGYNQIKLDKFNQDKTSFVISQGIFSYKVMSFGLKNARPTYQRLVNKMFIQQIGRNVEVFVDDIMVKSRREDHLLDNLQETFETLHLYNMKLNPSNCVFRVSWGKFLGFMVSQWGVKANLDKIKAMLEMESLKNVKEVQSLNGRVAALIGSPFEWLTNACHSLRHLRRTSNGRMNAEEPSRSWRYTLHPHLRSVHLNPIKSSPFT